MDRRLACALILVAVGCGGFNEPIASPDPAPNDAPAERPAQASEPAPSTDANGGGGADTPAPSSDPGSATTPTPGCKVGFQKDVLPKLAVTCAQAACHADQMTRPFIVESSAQTTHEELMEFDFGSIEWSDPHSEYSGASEPEVKKAIDAWRLCGAKLN